jgi:hypothetical protein
MRRLALSSALLGVFLFGSLGTAHARVLRCGSFTAPGERVSSVRWDVIASYVSCRTAFPVIRSFTKTGHVKYGWRCVGEDTLSRCRNGRWFVKAVSRE